MYQNGSELNSKRDFSSPNSSKPQKIHFSGRKILNFCSEISIFQTHDRIETITISPRAIRRRVPMDWQDCAVPVAFVFREILIYKNVVDYLKQDCVYKIRRNRRFEIRNFGAFYL